MLNRIIEGDFATTLLQQLEKLEKLAASQGSHLGVDHAASASSIRKPKHYLGRLEEKLTIAYYKQILNELKDSQEPLSIKKYLVWMESRFKGLWGRPLIEAYEKKDADLEDADTAKVYLNHSKMPGSDSFLTVTPLSLVNRFFMLIDSAVRSVGEYDNLGPYDLLMPDLKGDASNLLPHQFILANDGTVVDVSKCLDHALWAGLQRDVLLHHSDVSERLLTEAERDRVINSSPVAKIYYDAISLKKLSMYDLVTFRKDLLNYLAQNKEKAVVLDDKGKQINVLHCLDQHARNLQYIKLNPDSISLALYHTDGSGRRLSQFEDDLIHHHSTQSQEYYDAILYCLKTNDKERCEAAAHDFHSAIARDKSKTYIVNEGSYSQYGYMRQAQYIMTLIPSREALLDIMVNDLRREERKSFLNYISDEDLFKLFGIDLGSIKSLNGDKYGEILYAKTRQLISAILPDNIEKPRDIDYAQASVVLLLEIYGRARELGPDHFQDDKLVKQVSSFIGKGISWFADAAKNYGGYYVPNMIKSYSRQDKVDENAWLQAKLLSGSSLKHLDKSAKNYGCAMDGALGLIVNYAMSLGREFEPEPVLKMI